MRNKILKYILPFIAALSISLIGFALPQPTTQPSIIPSPPAINASAYVLMDANSGKILASKNMDQKLPPASLTKMMTMYVVSQQLANGNIKIDDNVRISKVAWKMGGSKMFVKVGNQVPVKDLIQGIVVDSGNDACVAMSEYVAGSQDSFTEMMNTQAKNLKMNDTNFTDCTGLSHPNHYSSAHDLALLAQAIINNYPEDYKWYSQKWFTYSGIKQPNRNRLLWRFPGTDGLKTGHTDKAGFCLVASAKKDNLRLISIVLGAPSDEARAQDSIKLLTYGFRFFQSKLLYKANETISKQRVWAGQNKTVPVGVVSDFYATVPFGQFQNIKTAVKANENLTAPIKKGQEVGQIIVTLQGKQIAQTPLLALSDDPQGGMWRRSVDYVAKIVHGWFA
jgi:serine-type D-Ala-D-Ala carboxypeptidase (penicillin-binding protein 5/6)